MFLMKNSFFFVKILSKIARAERDQKYKVNIKIMSQIPNKIHFLYT
jgi:hypothetical protein